MGWGGWGVGGAYLADIRVRSKYNKGIWLLLCVIDMFGKYAWTVTFKSKKDITVTKTIKKNLDESNRIPNKIWMDKVSKF